MSYYPYGGGRGYSSLSSSFNEPAGPRKSDGITDRRYHHRVIPVQQDGAPHYAQYSALYPMQAHSESMNSYQYRPEDGKIDGSQLSSGSQAVVIPVVHLGSNRDPSNTIETYNTSTNHPSSFYDSRSVALPTGSHPRSSSGPRKLTTTSTGAEAEVDALTNVLLRSMEKRPSVTSSSLLGHESSTSSPTSSVLRGVGSYQNQVASPTAGLTNSRLARFQQQQTQNSASPGVNINGGRGSPSTAATATTGSTGSPRTSSPASSVSSAVGDAAMQNNCYRCRRPLVPPEGTTLSPVSPPVVTLTGALAVRIHASCFTCYMCKTPLTPNAYYHNLHRLLCPTCVRDGAVESCAKCHRPIGERTVRALGLPYHPGCFTCSVCNSRLESKPFTMDVLGRPLCIDDFHRKYAPRCAVCNRPIAPEPATQEARRVVAGDSNYHLSCYGVTVAPQPSNATTPTPKPIATS